MTKSIDPKKVPSFATYFQLKLLLHVAGIFIVVLDHAVIPGV